MDFWVIVNILIAGLVFRQLLVLRGVLGSVSFLQDDERHKPICKPSASPLIFYVVLPVLREASRLRQMIKHFEALTEDSLSKIIVVTTARETAEAAQHAEAADTVALARELAADGSFIHLHFPDQRGLKADQLNFAADYCVNCLLGDLPPQQAFVVVYDADSRPPLDSLTQFEQAIARHPEVSVFHQSSRFELRATSSVATRSWVELFRRAVADSGALRANRFVLAYELPRLLNRSDIKGERNRIPTSYIYTHVTGHGLCLRLSLLRELRFPARSPLEDMHYSFLLDSRNTPMVPIASLDCAEVPDSVAAQFQQLARWFWGPSRFLHYATDPATRPGWQARFVAASAAAITIQWLSCAVLLPLLGAMVWFGNTVTHVLIGVLLATYATQLAIVDNVMSAGACRDRVLRLLMYPISFTLYGLAGIVGLWRLIRGGSETRKTERR